MCGSCWSSTSRHKGTLNLLPLLRRGLFTSRSHPAQGTSPAPAFGRLKNPGPALSAYFPLHSTGKPAIICLEDCIFLPGRGLCGPPCSYRTPEGGILMQKLIIAIVSNEDSTAASRALTKGGFSVTRLGPHQKGVFFHQAGHNRRLSALRQYHHAGRHRCRPGG